MSKTTTEQFRLFESECWRWIHLLGLRRWKVTIMQADLKGKAFAQTSYQDYYHSAKTWLDANSGEVSSEQFESAALHEMLHLLLAPLRAMAAKKGSVEENDIQSETHAILNILVGVIIGDEEGEEKNDNGTR